MGKKVMLFLIKVLSMVLIVLLLCYLFKSCCSLGYRIFDDKARTAPDSPDMVQAVVTITENESLLSIGQDLEKKEIVSDKYAFAISIRFMEGYDSIIPGAYPLNSSMKPSDILKTITTPTEEKKE